MSTRVSISLPPSLERRYNKIPEGSRAAVVRKLLEAYIRAYDADPATFDAVLQGNIYLEKSDDT